MNSESFADWVNRETRARGWSLRQTAKKIGVSHTAVIRLANGETHPSPEMCQRMAEAFGVAIETVYERAGLLPARGDVLPEVAGWSGRLRGLGEDQRRAVIAGVETLLGLAERR